MISSIRQFPKSFYVANGMEIFERLAWYGFFTLSSLYMTTPIEQGGVGFSDAQRGALQGIIPFFLYMLPVITGALADRYGYRKMFLLSFIIMSPSYFLLGQAESFGSFFLAFFAIALGAACFKPVVQGTISLTTNDSNRGLGFGIFYTMVNVGGFAGPIVAGYVRAISWDMVFLMSSLWITLNFLPLFFLYKDPETRQSNNAKLSTVLKQAQEVLGNARFALLLFPGICFLMAAGAQWISYIQAFSAIIIWLIANLMWDNYLRRSGQGRRWFTQTITVSNPNFAIYLAIMAGFWAVYNQLFYTLPLYLRDFVDTQDLVRGLAVFGAPAQDFFASVNLQQLTEKLQALSTSSQLNSTDIHQQLIHLKLRVPKEVIAGGLQMVQQQQLSAATLAQRWADSYRQINPEYIINIGFAVIILCQLLISYICQKFKTINVLISGVSIFSVGIAIAILANHWQYGGAFVVAAVMMMSVGEMVTVPKSQEYVASIAPKNQAALYMGYYFVSMALGFLLAGLLSGWAYGTVAKEWNQPDLMWAIFSVIGISTCIALFWFNRRQL